MDFLKRAFYILFCIALLAQITLAFSENPYLYDGLELEYGFDGEILIDYEKSSSEIITMNASVLLVPFENGHQEVEEINTKAKVDDQKAVFSWTRDELRNKNEVTFSLESKVRTKYKRKEISNKITFPIDNIEDYLEDEPKLLEYLEETESIDFSNPAIIRKANELVAGKEDLFEASFALASWVEENIAYDLNSLTQESTQKSSWVLENRQGVCDEMTSLFVAMARSVGIPAKFITGVSYTNSELFTNPWQAHGWAEVYFPGEGWVSFDPTFGEFGYVDVTHIKLKESKEPLEASTIYQWVAKDVGIEAKDLHINVEVLEKGDFIEDEFSLEMESLGEEFAFGSFNIIKAIVKNNKEHYMTTQLSLALPEDIDILDNKKKNVILEPKELKEVYWLIHIPDFFDRDYIYTFPYIVHTEKNISLKDSFKAKSEGISYSFDEAKELLPQENDLSFSRRATISCEYPQKVEVSENFEMLCTLSNKGNVLLEEVSFCIDDICDEDDIGINRDLELKRTVSFTDPGWKNIIIKAENEDFEKSEVSSIKVLDKGNIALDTQYPQKSSYGETIVLAISLEQESFNKVSEIQLELKERSKLMTWEIEKLEREETILVEIDSKGLGKRNKFPLTLTWKDELGEEYTYTNVVELEIEAKNFKEKIILFFNGIF